MKCAKKLLSFALAAVISVTLLTSCGGKDEYREKYESLLSEVENQSSEEETEKTDETESPESSENDYDSEPEEPTPDTDFDTSGKIKKTVIYDKDNIKITATELTYTSYEAELNLLIENNSSKGIKIHSGTISYACTSINGYMTDDGFISCSLGANKKSNETAAFDYHELKLLGINGIGIIDFGFSLENDDSYEPFYEGHKSIKTTQYDKYKDSKPSLETLANNEALLVSNNITKERFSKDTVYNQNNVSMTSNMLAKRDNNRVMFFEFGNKSGSDSLIRFKDVEIDDISVSSGNYTSRMVINGCKGILSIELDNLVDDSYKGIVDTDKAGTISFDVAVYKTDGKTEIAPQKHVSFKLSENSKNSVDEGNVIYNKNGIKIIPRGVADDRFESSADKHLLFMIQNNYSKDIRVDLKSNSLSVNGYMTSEITWGESIAKGKSGILDVEMQGSSLKKNKITKTSDIKNAELVVEIVDSSYNDVDEVTLNVNYN